jgi:hypothetical protein
VRALPQCTWGATAISVSTAQCSPARCHHLKCTRNLHKMANTVIPRRKLRASCLNHCVIPGPGAPGSARPSDASERTPKTACSFSISACNFLVISRHYPVIFASLHFVLPYPSVYPCMLSLPLCACAYFPPDISTSERYPTKLTCVLSFPVYILFRWPAALSVTRCL